MPGSCHNSCIKAKGRQRSGCRPTWRRWTTMTTKDIEWATWCALHDVGKFYRSKRWRAVRRQVLQADHYECQTCRFKYNRYRKADTVHHINPFKLRPDLALEPTYHDPATHKQRRNLAGLIYLRRFRRTAIAWHRKKFSPLLQSDGTEILRPSSRGGAPGSGYPPGVRGAIFGGSAYRLPPRHFRKNTFF